MISGRELAYGLVGAWRLIRNDPGGVQYFDRSPSGALRSFWAMALVAPAFAVLLMMGLHKVGVDQIGLRQVLLGGGIYVINWLLFPVMLLRLAPKLGREQEVATYIAANNWAQILIAAVSLFLGAVAATMPKSIGEMLDLALLALIALMQYRLLRHAMALNPPQAGLLVFAYLCLDIAASLALFGLLVPGKLAA
ncbi:MAG: hypothetical protein K0S54_2051 [Alphaproteobacteria bacterium]|jgi:hypothetical protein|nr:hypothetical protein [Alphaproteobacteria bacterium]